MSEVIAGGSSMRIAVRAGDVHVWRARLDEVDGRLDALRAMLSSEEHARIARFRFSADRRRAIVARGLLRLILGRCLDRDPSRLRFTYGPQGKPALGGGSDLQFNVAHSGNLVLWAVTREHPVGIDVEQIRPGLDWPAVARGFFAAREVAALRALPSALHEEAFFACWTRKESYLKAIGLGLRLSPAAFAVTVDPRGPAALLSIDGGAVDAAARWSLVDVAVDTGYRACLAVPHPAAQPVCHEVDGHRLR